MGYVVEDGPASVNGFRAGIYSYPQEDRTVVVLMNTRPRRFVGLRGRLQRGGGALRSPVRLALRPIGWLAIRGAGGVIPVVRVSLPRRLMGRSDSRFVLGIRIAGRVRHDVVRATVLVNCCHAGTKGISVMDYARRLDGLRQTMQKRGIDLAVYGPCPNFQYLTGVLVDWRGAPDLQPAGDLLLVPREGSAVRIASGRYATDGCPIADVLQYDAAVGYKDLMRTILRDRAVEVRKLALGAYLPTPVVTAAIEATGHPELCDASHLLDPLRAIKEPEEVALLRKVARLTDEAMMTVVRGIMEGVSQFDLRLEIEAEGRRRGATDVSFGPWAGYVKSGSSATFPGLAKGQVTDYPVDKGLVANTAITFDVGFVWNGYCSDWGRSVYWGTAPEHTRNAYAALRQAVVETVAEMKDGNTRACDVYPAIERRLDALGFGDEMRARLAPGRTVGHQIGTEVHENPWLRPDSEEPLRAGMVMCIEPKLWLPGEYYLRLEEMVHITETGAEFLTEFDRELFEL